MKASGLKAMSCILQEHGNVGERGGFSFCVLALFSHAGGDSMNGNN
jgi:hypothetical protein